MLEAERDQTTQNLCDPESQVPQHEPRGLLGLGVVLAADEHQGRTDGRLEDAQEDPRHQECGVVVRAGRGSGSDAPEEDIDTEPLRGRHFLQEDDCARATSVSREKT